MSRIGDCLGQYELRKLLGSGGQGEVWQALDTNLGRNVAIKILYPPWREDALKRFKREAMALAALRHPHIVQVYDFFTPSSSESENLKACMVMEYIEGQTLEDYIKNTSHKGKFPSSQDILYLFTAIGSAIDAAHRERIIHRDIKPANILLDKRYTSRNAMGKPVLTDFGLVKLLGAPMGSSTRLGLGTPAYSSPEQARGSEGSKLSDIYSLGVILYEIYTGERPFQAGNNVAIIMQHIEGIFTPPMQLNPAISPELNAVISRSMDKNPENRFLSAFAMTSALANALQLPIPKFPSVPDYSQNDDIADWPTPLDSLSNEEEYPSYVPTPASENIAETSSPAHVAQQPPTSVVSPPPVQPPTPPRRAARKRPRNILIVLTFLVLVALIIVAALGWTSLFPRGNARASCASQVCVSALNQLLKSDTAVDSAGDNPNGPGLDNDLLWRAESIMSWSLQAKYHRQPQELSMVHQEFGDILYYLDGQCASQDFNNVPSSFNGMNSDASIANTKTGLLDCNGQGYLSLIKQALTSIMNASDATSKQQQLASQIIQYINSLNTWLGKIRQDAQKLIQMSNPDFPTIKDMEAEAQNLYAGWVDSSGVAQPGVGQIYGYIKAL